MTTFSRVLLGYCVTVTTLLAASAAAGLQDAKRFDEIDVQRINVRESDGTLRMTISNTARAPGIVVKNKERPHPSRQSAGILFFNDEGTENGGLIFGGSRKDGKASGYGHLSFDQYEQDQVVALTQSEEGGVRRAGLTISDRPDTPLPFDLVEDAAKPENKAKLEQMAQEGAFGQPRLFVGKSEDRASTVVLKDAQGRPRLVMQVTAQGSASIDFLDENGKTVRTLAPAASGK